ncbi:hypothetical protein [Pseudoalteromonas sp. S16_S37]|uniref:hypothetical protein n=1 Tax=Pseudoalteromonas sp. S16_S37 TaxID=2720228 RepID=UPI0016805798|nr:hypothetical protein [Pseudoalteromonas sp. S16_S37]MBD1584879.1 hypothetical protein [Pseudoalteromonas sp. S16_S37]
MDISTTKWHSSSSITSKTAHKAYAVTSQNNVNTSNVSISPLALKLKTAQEAIDKAQLNNQAMSWHSDKQTNQKHVAAAKWEFEHLSKAQLETVALDPSKTFSQAEKVAAYERWHVLDQAQLSDMQRQSLNKGATSDTKTMFEASLNAHIESFSALAKEMISSNYEMQAKSQFDTALKELHNSSKNGQSQYEHYYAVMVNDLFEGKEPAIIGGVNGMSHANVLKNPIEFLTQEDRDLLTQMYQYADHNEVDFKYIQRLASDLGNYRKHDDGKLLGNFNEGHFDAQGRQLSVEFTDRDKTTVDSLLATQSRASSALDKGFLSFMTDPGRGGISHMGSYQFLHHMVEVTAGEQTSVSADTFNKYVSASANDDRYVLSASKTSTIEFEPDVVCKNGHCEVTEKGQSNGVTITPEAGNSAPAMDLKSAALESIIQLRKHEKTQENIWYQWLAND